MAWVLIEDSGLSSGEERLTTAQWMVYEIKKRPAFMSSSHSGDMYRGRSHLLAVLDDGAQYYEFSRSMFAKQSQICARYHENEFRC